MDFQPYRVTRSTRQNATVFATVLAALPFALQAQTTSQVGDRPSCATCQAVLEPVVQLGSVDDPGGFAPIVQIAVSSAGQYVVSSPTFTGELFVYSPDGKFQRSIGRRGEGPGEFNRLQFVAFGTGDTLHAIEASGPRHSIFTPGLTFVRAVQLRARTLAMEIEADGSVFAVSPTTGDPGHALQVFSTDGASVLSFDPIDPSLTGQAALGRSIAVDDSGSRWSIGTAQYRIKQWDPLGRLVRQFDANRDWISENIPMRLERDQKPPGQIGGLEFDESGMLWVFAIVPDANWSPPQAGSRPGPNDTYDTLLEVVDPATGTLLARGRLDQLALPFAPGRACSMIEDTSGDLRLQVWSMEVVGR